jgi:Protein of unknown function (DUF3592)
MTSATAGLIFYGLGATALLFSLYARHRERLVAAWPTVTGSIIESRVYTDVDDSRPEITYDYQFGGKKYRSSQVLPHGMLSTTGSYASNLVAKYPAGSLATVHVNPARPGDSALETAIPTLMYVLLNTAVIVFVAFGFVFRS